MARNILKKIRLLDRFYFECRSQKTLVLLNESFFIHCESNGISSRVSVYIIKGALPPLYLITPLGVYQKTLAMMIYKTKVLMICNSYGIDDIQRQAVDFH